MYGVEWCALGPGHSIMLQLQGAQYFDNGVKDYYYWLGADFKSTAPMRV